MRPLTIINRAALLILFILLSMTSAIHAEKPEHEIKFASLAPDGSSWMQQMRELDAAVRDSTNGKVGFKLYPGGVQGDEQDVIRKMRFNQLHAAGFTGNGLGEILPEMRVLELPFLFHNKDEVDLILDTFTDQFDQAFRDKGYVLLGWTEVGYVYFFSNTPIYTGGDLKGMKVWTWQGDPLAAALFKAMDVTPVPLSITEVMTALQTGMIDAVYTSPMAAISLQWFSRTKYMNLQPITNSMGAVLLTLKSWDKLDESEQKALLEVSRDHLRQLTLTTRIDNRKSIEQLEQAGLTMIPVPGPEALEQYHQIGNEVRQNLVGNLYSEELLAEIMQTLDTYRAESAIDETD
ncbi:MAG TPA: ABC transporter substrate-binding protein [Bacteroidetes bacterium]|nr:2,3-diketo-L-gulonate-binding periplasmic protein YiaO precursor [bacterium BMS3Bbin04]HDO65136.1 ABC transporter substrate-binding protein [Bacteroidota bacterium]HEX04261.1 ABC transporter substrate-binding protein [Bacteroidota bacterium]